MIAALPVIAAALVGLLVVLALWALMRPQLELLAAAAESGIPGIGGALGWLLRQQDALLSRAYSRLVGWGLAAIPPLIAAITNPVFQLWRYTNANNAAHVAMFQAMQRLVLQTIPAAAQQAMNYAESRVGWVTVYAQTLYWQAIDYAATRVNQAIEYATALQAQEDAFVRAFGAQIIAYAEALQAQEDRFVRAFGQTIIDYATALQAQEDAFVRGLFAQALGFAEDAFGRAIEFEQRLYGEGIRYADAIWVRARDYAQALHATSIAYTVAAVAAVAVRVARIETSKCQRFCNPLGDLGEVLQDLQGLGVATLFLGLAAEMARDPQGSARMLNDTLGPPLRGAIDAIKSEAGIR